MAVKTYRAAVTIKIDHDECIGAGECVNVCPSDVYELVNGKSTAPRVEDCVECCACVEACPTKAIEHSSC
ncbi:MAG: 4Fe-4S binding protein [Euryarchaeota archaeon]|nr:4Fe-4S binding protein [Euryarchaeota archaeon]